MSILPNKETTIKLTSVIIGSTGAVVSAVGRHNQALSNAGAVANLLGSLLDDVPEAWVKQRAIKKYTQLLGLVRDNHAKASMSTGENVGRAAQAVGDHALVKFFDKTFALEIAHVEHLTSILKAITSGVSFGFSVHNPAVAGFGAGGIALGALVGWVTTGLMGPNPVPANPPQPDINNPPLAPRFDKVGDYKSAISVGKFCGSLGALIGCGVGLGVAAAVYKHSSDPSEFSKYAETKFLAAAASAAAAGAAFGSAVVTIHTRVASTINFCRNNLREARRDFTRQNPAEANGNNPHATIPVLGAVRRGFGIVFMGKVIR